VKIFLSGPISGDPEYKSKFNAVEEKLKAQGHLVWNPAMHPDGFEHYEYMAVCLPAVLFCDCVAFLEGWDESPGSLKEFNYAISHGRKVLMPCEY